MKKLLIIIIAFFALALSSCTEEMYGDYGIVTEVKKYDKAPTTNYDYSVRVKQNTARPTDGYIFHTHRLYHVGDTIEIVGRKYK